MSNHITKSLNTLKKACETYNTTRIYSTPMVWCLLYINKIKALALLINRIKIHNGWNTFKKDVLLRPFLLKRGLISRACRKSVGVQNMLDTKIWALLSSPSSFICTKRASSFGLQIFALLLAANKANIDFWRNLNLPNNSNKKWNSRKGGWERMETIHGCQGVLVLFRQNDII